MFVFFYVCMHGRMDGRMGGCMDGSMHSSNVCMLCYIMRCMHACTYSCRLVDIHVQRCGCTDMVEAVVVVVGVW